MAAAQETRAFQGESREKKEKPRLEQSIESLVSAKHPGYNEDGALGDVMRLQREAANPPEIQTADPAADLEAVRRGAANEMQFAQDLQDRNVFAVGDGVSGSKGAGAGLVANRVALGKVAEIMSYMPKDATAERATKSIEAAIQQAHLAILDHRKGRPDLKEMATTMDVIKTVDNGDGTHDVAYGHVGDSRIYVFDSATGKLEAKTLDDNFATLALEGKGLKIGNMEVPFDVIAQKYGLERLTRDDYDLVSQAGHPEELPPNLQKFYKMRNMISNAVGLDSPSINVRTGVFKVKEGDRVIVTSDGIHDNLTDDQIEAIMQQGGGMKELAAAARKVAESGEGRAKMDDISGSEIEIPERENRRSGEHAKAAEAQPMSAEQRAQAERAVQDAGVEVALLEDLRKISTGEQDTKDSRDYDRIRQYGGTDGIEDRIRDIKIFSLSHENQLLQSDMASRQREAGIDPAQAEKDLGTQKDVLDWQNKVLDAARMQQSGKGSAGRKGVSMDAVQFVGERMKAGMPIGEIVRQAEQLKGDAERKIGLLNEVSRDNARMQEIAAEWRSLAEEKQQALQAREARRMDEAQRGVGAAYGEKPVRSAGPEAANKTAIMPAPKKKPWWKVW